MGEIQTFLFMAAYLANERPVDARSQSGGDSVEYISPNSLSLGRARPRGNSGNFLFEGCPYKRLQSISDKGQQILEKLVPVEN